MPRDWSSCTETRRHRLTRSRAAAAKKPAKQATPAAQTLTQQRRTFCETYWTDKNGHPFSLVGRQWVIDHMWRPLDGYKAWPVAWADGRMLPGERLCDDCKVRANTLIDHPREVEETQRAEHHEATGCRGLRATKIIVVVECLPRREGKTTNAMGYCASSIFKLKNQLIMYIAAAEDQADDLVEKNFKRPVRKNPELMRRVHMPGLEISVPNLNSQFVALPASFRSVTGRGPNLAVIDEARDVQARLAMAFLNSIPDAGGTECPTGHWSTQEKEDAPTECPVCGTPTQVFYGLALIMSAAGMEEGSEEHDWFKDLVELLEEEPHPHYYLHRRDERSNPAVSRTAVTAISDVFGRMKSTKSYALAEGKNQFTRKGEDFLTDAEIARCIDKTLQNHTGSTRPCVAFLDTSDVGELTSLVIVGQDDKSTEPFKYMLTERIDFWRPQEQPNKVVDDALILKHLDMFMPMFPGLLALRIDTRLRPWARSLVKTIKSSPLPNGGRRSWAHVTDGWDRGADARAIGYSALESAVLELRIRMQDHAVLRAEFKGVRATRGLNNALDVRDRNRRRRHADILDALSVCCLLALEHSLAPKRRTFAELDEKKEIRAILDRAFPKPMTGPGKWGGF